MLVHALEDLGGALDLHPVDVLAGGQEGLPDFVLAALLGLCGVAGVEEAGDIIDLQGAGLLGDLELPVVGVLLQHQERGHPATDAAGS